MHSPLLSGTVVLLVRNVGLSLVEGASSNRSTSCGGSSSVGLRQKPLIVRQNKHLTRSCTGSIVSCPIHFTLIGLFEWTVHLFLTMEAVHFMDNWRKDLHVSQEAVDMDHLKRNMNQCERQTHQALQGTSVDLIETGKGLKFQAERPHLVSLGSGRLSTAITVLPLPEGRTSLGHGTMDISIHGPGVAGQHCYIENRSGVITLHPCGNLCAVDGLQVTKALRLSQEMDVSTLWLVNENAAGEPAGLLSPMSRVLFYIAID